MSDEYDLFDGKPPSQAHSETSQAAAEEIAPSVSRLQSWVCAAIKKYPATDEELVDRTGIPPNTLRPRRRELELKGMIRKSGIRRKTKSGRWAEVWEAVS